MTNFRRSLFWAVMIAITAMACNDPSNIGSDLVAGDFSDIRFTDTLTVSAITVPQDSIFTYTRQTSAQPSSYLVGNTNEPVFGSAKASLYMDFLLNTTNAGGALNFEGAVFDSLVLSLAYDSTRTYGDTLIPQTLEVHRLQESMDDTEDYYYSNTSFATDPTPVGSKEDFLPRPKSASYLPPFDTIPVAGHIRIPLDASLGMEFMDTTYYNSSEEFQQLFKGLKISSSVDNASILGFNLRSNLSYLRLYYTEDTTQKFLTYIIGDLSVKYNEFEHDYSGADIEPFLNDATMSDSLVFTQGMSGANVKIDFPSVDDLGDIVVNKAELEFTMAHIPGDDTINFNPIDRITLTYLNEDGNYFFIDDVNLAIAVGSLSSFGGIRESEDVNGVYVQKYRMNISNYFQDILDCTDANGAIPNCLGNSAVSNSLYMQVYLKNQLANRGVLYGPGHSQYPAKLHLTYTIQ